MPKAFNTVTAEINRIEIGKHSIFKRLFEQEGFTLLNSAQLTDFLAAPGLKMLVFADDPNERKTTLDMAVIAPELKKAFSGTLSLTAWADFKEARSLALRWGLRSLPAVAIFLDANFLGAVQGLKPWDEYCRLLSEIVRQDKPAIRTIAIMPERSHEDCDA